MKVMTAIPHTLKGRGPNNCVPIECDCGETFLFPNGRGRVVTCPTCKIAQTFADDDATFDVSHNGQDK
jgi:hypothetical protein